MNVLQTILYIYDNNKYLVIINLETNSIINTFFLNLTNLQVQCIEYKDLSSTYAMFHRFDVDINNRRTAYYVSSFDVQVHTIYN